MPHFTCAPSTWTVLPCFHAHASTLPRGQSNIDTSHVGTLQKPLGNLTYRSNHPLVGSLSMLVV